MRLANLSLLIILVSCSHLSSRPVWMEEISSYCQKNQICASGSGLTREQAKINATISLSKIFSTEISSVYSSTLQNEERHISENSSEEIKEVTQSILEGVNVDQFYNEKNLIYALAVLDKNQMSASLLSEMELIDNKILALQTDGSIANLLEIEKLLTERYPLFKKYQFITGIKKLPKISLDDIKKQKIALTQNIVISVQIKNPLLNHQISSLLSEYGYTLSKTKSYTHILEGSLEINKEFLDVSDFEKYTFKIKLSTTNKQNLNENDFQFQTTETARNKNQAMEKAMVKIQNELSNKVPNFKFK